ncbi:MAG: hypothetical protein HON55_00145 [Legionellales bacterium]|jgi:ATP/ADP translocase|nr:hypothetical protein [Legionellales bacterium]
MQAQDRQIIKPYPYEEWLPSVHWDLFYIEFSYYFITSLIDVVWQYQMCLMYVTSVAFTAATSNVLIIGAVISFIVSLIIAPYINNNFSRRALGLIMPVLLSVLCAIFLGMVVFPGYFSAFFSLIGFPGVSILLLSCVVGAIIDIVQKAFKYSISDVFNAKAWNDVNDDQKQKSTNMLSSRPGKALGALLILILTSLSTNAHVSGMFWVIPFVILPLFILWLNSVNSVSGDGSAEVESKEEEPGFLEKIKNPSFIVMASICVLFVLGTTFLSVFKTTIIVENIGVEALPILKLAIIPAILISKYILKSSDEIFKEDSFLILLFGASFFFIAFAAVYPYANIIHAMSFSFSMLPGGLSAVLHCWLFSLFYIVAEVWSAASMAHMYQPIQNNPKTFSKEQLGYFIPLIAAASCVGQFLAASLAKTMVSFGLSMATMLMVIGGAFAFTSFIAGAVYKYGLNKGIIKIETNNAVASVDGLKIKKPEALERDKGSVENGVGIPVPTQLNLV